MTDNKEPIWSEIRNRRPVNDLVKYGPSIEVSVGAIGSGPMIKTLAQIDTGAAGTGIRDTPNNVGVVTVWG